MAKKKFNNPHQVDNEKADEILRLDNGKLVDEAASNYRGLSRVEMLKKEDGQIISLNEQLIELRDEIKNDPQVVDLEDQLKALKENLLSEEQARLEEEIKNMRQPYTEDVKTIKGIYKLCMDEINRRRDNGIMKF